MNEPKEKQVDVNGIACYVATPAPEPLFCRWGWHKWKDLLVRGVNIFAPMFPAAHYQTCERCGRCRRIGHTLYGDVVTGRWDSPATLKAHLIKYDEIDLAENIAT